MHGVDEKFINRSSLLFSPEPASSPYHSQLNPVHILPACFLWFILKWPSHLRRSVPSSMFLSVFWTNILYVFTARVLQTSPSSLPRHFLPVGTLLDIICCLRDVWCTRRFGSWFFFRLQVIGFLTDTICVRPIIDNRNRTWGLWNAMLVLCV
jgi:hypothetical protein